MPSVNDNFALRTALSGASGSANADISTNTIETQEKYTVNDVVEATRIAGLTAWWAWTAPATGEVEFVLSGGSPGQAHLAVTTGATSASSIGTIITLASGRGRAEARARFRAVASTVYFLQAGQLLDGPAVTTVTLTWSQPPSATRPSAVSGSYKGRDTAALDNAQVA